MVSVLITFYIQGVLKLKQNSGARRLNQKNYILNTKRIKAVEIDGIKENIRLKIRDDTEDNTNGMNGDKIDTNVIEYQKGDQESNDTGFGRVENNKHPSAEGKQHTEIS